MGLKLDDFMICTQIIFGGRVHKNSLFKFAENFRDGQSWKLNIFDLKKNQKLCYGYDPIWKFKNYLKKEDEEDLETKIYHKSAENLRDG